MMRRWLKRLRQVLRHTMAPAIGVIIFLASPAAIAAALEVRVREAALDPGGAVRLIVSVTGEGLDRPLTAADFRVTEGGRPAQDLQAEPLLQSRIQAVSVALLLDTSGSTRGAPLADAKAAATAFLGQLPAEVQVALVGFGPTPYLLSDFTSDRGALASAIQSLQAGGETGLYDAVAVATSTLSRFQGQRNIVLFSDGGDTVSRVGLEEALGLVNEAQVRVTSVGLVTPEFDQAALDRFAAETEGRSLPVGRSNELTVAFAEVAKEIASQYVLTYVGTSVEPRELDISVHVAVGAASADDSIAVLNPRTAPPPQPEVWRLPVVGFLASRSGLLVSVLVAFAALAVLTFVLLSAPSQGRDEPRQQTGLLLPQRPQRRRSRWDTKVITSELGRRVIEFLERAQNLKRRHQESQLLLERAGWPMRASEFTVIRAAAALSGTGLGIIIFDHVLLGLMLGLLGAFAPLLLLKIRGQQRSAKFLLQLPDTLQIFSGSLEAGYGLMQVIDTVVLESSPPTSVEFARVMAESRLGVSLEDSLLQMADRMGSKDFRWVVLAINIQRQVGGNLAQLLSSVASTLRQREQFRRQIKVLSAEGRISAWILALLPFALVAILSRMNPEYLSALPTTFIGRVMMLVAAFLMGFGILWMKKIVRIRI